MGNWERNERQQDGKTEESRRKTTSERGDEERRTEKKRKAKVTRRTALAYRIGIAAGDGKRGTASAGVKVKVSVSVRVRVCEARGLPALQRTVVIEMDRT